MSRLPCINCITFPICKSEYMTHRDRVGTTESGALLAEKCSIFRAWKEEPENVTLESFHLFFSYYIYFKDMTELLR